MTSETPSPAPADDLAARALHALRESAAEARRIAARTGTRLIVVRDGALVAEVVPPCTPPAPGA